MSDDAADCRFQARIALRIGTPVSLCCSGRLLHSRGVPLGLLGTPDIGTGSRSPLVSNCIFLSNGSFLVFDFRSRLNGGPNDVASVDI